MSNEEKQEQRPAEQQEQLTPEQVKEVRRKQLGNDFELGRTTKHLRLPYGLEK